MVPLTVFQIEVTTSAWDIIFGVLTFIATSLLYGIYRYLRGWARRFESLEKRVGVLDLNTKILIRTMGELDPRFAKIWNRYAAVYKQPLIDEHNHGLPGDLWTAQDQVEWEDRLMKEIREEGDQGKGKT